MDVAGTGFFPQIVIVILLTAVIYFLYMTAEQAYKIFNGYSKVRVPILTVTANSMSGQKIFTQDPNNSKSKSYLPLALSENQLTGIEFSYTTFVYINTDTDDGNAGWKTLFYKGYASAAMPLLSPGVFVSSANSDNGAPTLRIVMNSYDSWFNSVDIPQITFNKWFHLAIVLRRNNMEVYIDGNLATTMPFKGTLPYQNYQPLVLFPNSVANTLQVYGSVGSTAPTSFDNTSGEDSNVMGLSSGQSMVVTGKFSGYISNMFYYGYALTYSEIQAAMAMGPSSQFDNTNMDNPPYLIDSWWTNTRA
jgi:hypothetical protein